MAVSQAEFISKFWSKVKKTDTCWLWTGWVSPYGYGYTTRNYKSVRVHRLSYELHKGLIPDGLVIDHLCRVKTCVNPEHLEAVTNRENVLRGIGPSAENARRTNCLKGHPLERRKNGDFRRCSICAKESNRKLSKKRAAAKGHVYKPRNETSSTCKAGHEYTMENTYHYVRDGKPRRQCRNCNRAKDARRRARGDGK